MAGPLYHERDVLSLAEKKTKDSTSRLYGAQEDLQEVLSDWMTKVCQRRQEYCTRYYRDHVRAIHDRRRHTPEEGVIVDRFVYRLKDHQVEEEGGAW